MNQQFSLFPPEAIGPPSLRYYPQIITPSMEFHLIERIRGLPLQPFQFGAFEGKRRVASFGFKYDYGQRRLQEAEQIPEWLAPMIEKVEAYGDTPPPENAGCGMITNAKRESTSPWKLVVTKSKLKRLATGATRDVQSPLKSAIGTARNWSRASVGLASKIDFFRNVVTTSRRLTPN